MSMNLTFKVNQDELFLIQKIGSMKGKQYSTLIEHFLKRFLFIHKESLTLVLQNEIKKEMDQLNLIRKENALKKEELTKEINKLPSMEYSDKRNKLNKTLKEVDDLIRYSQSRENELKAEFNEKLKLLDNLKYIK